jgi:hypothetical protein
MTVYGSEFWWSVHFSTHVNNLSSVLYLTGNVHELDSNNVCTEQYCKKDSFLGNLRTFIA